MSTLTTGQIGGITFVVVCLLVGAFLTYWFVWGPGKIKDTSEEDAAAAKVKAEAVAADAALLAASKSPSPSPSPSSSLPAPTYCVSMPGVGTPTGYVWFTVPDPQPNNKEEFLALWNSGSLIDNGTKVKRDFKAEGYKYIAIALADGNTEGFYNVLGKVPPTDTAVDTKFCGYKHGIPYMNTLKSGIKHDNTSTSITKLADQPTGATSWSVYDLTNLPTSTPAWDMCWIKTNNTTCAVDGFFAANSNKWYSVGTFDTTKCSKRKVDLDSCGAYTVLSSSVPLNGLIARSDINGGSIPVNIFYRSPNAKYNFVYQFDGNLVIYKAAGGVVWNSGVNTGSTSTVLKGDGSVVVFKDAVSMWSSNKVLAVSGAPYSLVMADNGVVEVRDKMGALSYGLNPVPPV